MLRSFLKAGPSLHFVKVLELYTSMVHYFDVYDLYDWFILVLSSRADLLQGINQ